MLSMASLAQFADIENIGTHAALEKLADVYREARRNRNQLVPYVTLYMKSGLGLRGQVLAVAKDFESATVLFLTHDPKAAEPVDLTYLNSNEIAGVTIHSALVISEYLSNGELHREPSAQLSRADVAQLLRSSLEELNSVGETKMAAEMNDIPETAPQELLQTLYLTVRDLIYVLKKLLAEDLSRQALQQIGFQFSLKVGEEARVQVLNNRCLITTGVRGSQILRVTRESIRENLVEFL